MLTRNAVVACNAAARTEGVRRGMRRRDAQARCPELVLLADNPDRDARAFEPVLAAVEALRPGVAPLRPGLLAIRAPGRFYGGEAARRCCHRRAARRDRGLGLPHRHRRRPLLRRAGGPARRRPGLAGRARRRSQPSSCATSRSTCSTDADGALVGLLQRLGLRRLGDLAALPARDVLTRFGAYGAKVHRLARGVDPVEPATRTPPPDLVREVPFEPPLASVEAVVLQRAPYR